MRKLTYGVLALAIVSAVAIGFFFKPGNPPAPVAKAPVATSTGPVHAVIGTSVDGRSIDAYTYGTGSTHLVFVGGMHGGYEWNSVLLAYNVMDYFKAHPTIIPKTLSVTIIPDANPDGTYTYIGKEGRFTLADVPIGPDTNGVGRLNANNVDLNRNFACHWQAKSTWRSEPESAGTAAFSEPEAQAIRDFMLKTRPVAVAFWHSASGAVYASECDNGVLPGTITLMNTYAHAAGYNAVKSFNAYPVTGDSEGWLASQNIPAVTVELSTHDSIEWGKNLAGVQALLSYYGNTTSTTK